MAAFNLFVYASRFDHYCHVTLAMTRFFCHSEPLAKPPEQVAPLRRAECNGLPLYGSGAEKATDGQSEFDGAVDRITRSAAYRVAIIGEKQRSVFD